jgi:GrpB-like predicted nucleotidyltransferase (UPF0157 family)
MLSCRPTPLLEFFSRWRDRIRRARQVSRNGEQLRRGFDRLWREAAPGYAKVSSLSRKAIETYGSTAVPGMRTKPILDILGAVDWKIRYTAELLLQGGWATTTRRTRAFPSTRSATGGPSVLSQRSLRRLRVSPLSSIRNIAGLLRQCGAITYRGESPC